MTIPCHHLLASHASSLQYCFAFSPKMPSGWIYHDFSYSCVSQSTPMYFQINSADFAQ